MPLAEGAAHGVLAGEADRHPFDQQRGEGERFGVRPLDLTGLLPSAARRFAICLASLVLMLKLAGQR